MADLGWLPADVVAAARIDDVDGDGDGGAARGRLVAGVAVEVARVLETPLPDLALLSRWGSPAPVAVPPAVALAEGPALVGVVHEVLLDPARRRAVGAWYTPSEVTTALAEWALAEAGDGTVVCDPAVGGGAFLLAAAERLARTGGDRRTIVAEQLVGADVDPVAAAAAEAGLALWAGGRAVPRVLTADALTLDAAAWPQPPDVVVGNPPFLGQLAVATARPRIDADALRRRFGLAANGYVDTAALFLLAAVRWVSPGGTVALVLPQSVLAARDAGGVRQAVLDAAALEIVWAPDRPVFGRTGVPVCGVVVRRRPAAGSAVRCYRGVPPQPVTEVDSVPQSGAGTWSALLTAGRRIPRTVLHGEATLGEWCCVTADFRDQYYGLAPFVLDDEEAAACGAGPVGPDGAHEEAFPRLVTVGSIDPAECRWGRAPVRYLKRTWAAPRVDRRRLEAESRLGPWLAARLVPKVVVAAQTRVVEAAVDARGCWAPVTPVVTVVPPPARLWHAAAALLAPPVTAWALHEASGAARAADALKLSAAQLRRLPTPAPGRAWDRAAVLLRRASRAGDPVERRRALLAAGRWSSLAYGVDDPATLEWWAARLPAPR